MRFDEFVIYFISNYWIEWVVSIPHLIREGEERNCPKTEKILQISKIRIKTGRMKASHLTLHQIAKHNSLITKPETSFDQSQLKSESLNLKENHNLNLNPSHKIQHSHNRKIQINKLLKKIQNLSCQVITIKISRTKLNRK